MLVEPELTLASDQKISAVELNDEYEPNLTRPVIALNKTKPYSSLKIAKDTIIVFLAIWGFIMITHQLVQGVRKINQTHVDPLPHPPPAGRPIYSGHHDLVDYGEHAKHAEHQDHDHKFEPEHDEIHKHQNEARSCDCGGSVAEALSLRCKYDSLAAAWLPPHCRDEELTAEFETYGPGPNGNWIYWADTNHTQVLSVPEIAALADDSDARFHMSWEWHVVHCIFYWRKQYRAQFRNIIVEPRDDSEDHIMHCMKVIQNRVWGTVAGVALNTDS
jgi:hypothetical protein